MILTPKEAAEELHISVNEVLRMCADGRIKAFKIGSLWKIPSDLLKRTIEMWAIGESERRKHENHQSDGGNRSSGIDRNRRI